MSELVVDGLQVVGVEVVGVAEVLLKIVDTREQNLAAALSRTEDVGAVVAILPLPYREDHLWEVSAGEIYTADLVIGLDAHVFHQMSQLHGQFVARRDGVVIHVGFNILEAIFERDIVRLDIITLQPIVELGVIDLIDGNDALVGEVVLRAGSEHGSHGDDAG